jgi:hypothetical protein
MKKMITLMLSVALFASAFAQRSDRINDGRGYGRDGQYSTTSQVYNNNGNYNDGRNNRDFQIDKINREFSYKINAVANNPYLRNGQKRRAIRDLEKQRTAQIQMVKRSYNDRSQYRHDDRRR